MTYEELKKDIAARTGHDPDVVDKILDGFRDVAHTGAEINWPEMGEFKVAQVPARKGKSFGTEWNRPAHGKVKFTPWKAYRNAVE